MRVTIYSPKLPRNVIDIFEQDLTPNGNIPTHTIGKVTRALRAGHIVTIQPVGLTVVSPPEYRARPRKQSVTVLGGA